MKKQPFWKMKQVKTPKHSPFTDTDRDGVINLHDCKPLNKNFQDVILYHGTTHGAAEQIRKEGLKIGHGINPVIYLTPHKETAKKYAAYNKGIVFKVRLSDKLARKHGIPIHTPPNQVTISEDISTRKIREIKK
jgi:RNA:NAD 2'-phosphotransferase (TPT1/KptA family)